MPSLPGIGTISDGSTSGNSSGTPGAADVTASLAPTPDATSTSQDATGGVNDSNYQAALGQLTSFQSQQQATPTPTPSAPAVDPSSSGGTSSPQWTQLENSYKSWLGTPYVYGGTTRSGADCSGFTSGAYSALGLNIGRTTGQQMASPLGHAVGVDGNWNSVQGQLQPGDLLFYGKQGASGPNAHVVMYIGNGQVVQAAHTGTNVAVGPMFSAASSDEPFAGARRYLSGGTIASSAPASGAAGQINNPADFAKALLTQMNDPITQANINSIVNWEGREGGNWHNTAYYNPLNTTLDMGGSKAMNSVGVRAYTDWLQGLQATQKTLSNGRYGDILAALAKGLGLGSGSYSGLSTWSGGGYSSI